ncbi:hypothetical protein ACHAWF_009329 [Thalassiosira exigua]
MGTRAAKSQRLQRTTREGRRRRWWNRAKSGSDRNGEAPRTEVYRDGKQEGARRAGGGREAAPSAGASDSSQLVENNKTGEEEAPHPVIVSTEEDGTVLIRLPPPQAGVREPQTMGSALDSEGQRPPLGDAAPEEEGETMYIKLPYPQQMEPPQRGQPRREAGESARRTLTELDPPPRGSPFRHPARRPPLPLSDRASDVLSKGPLGGSRHSRVHREESHGAIEKLRGEFDAWIRKHRKTYASHGERERRFGVWRRNHSRIKEKNQRHGPCRMTGKAVFGHNKFSDLEPEEFQARFLTGYRGPRAKAEQVLHGRNRHSGVRASRREAASPAMGGERAPPPSARRHPEIQRRLEEHHPAYGGSRRKWSFFKFRNCEWWDFSCLLQQIFGYQVMGGTREPVFDENTYPQSLDWREMGVVTDVKTQGSCGACWAITAVETIESAYAIATGELMELDEEEVIACDGTCEMCNGGWPQNAYEYVMDHNGLPEKTENYDADWLYTLTGVVMSGEESDEADEYTRGSYFASVCPAGYREGGEGGSGSGKSGDSNQYYFEETYDTTLSRYGQVSGYGYATDRCVCYTDGSGCDCDDQDEKTAVLNVASYGPAAVCLEASEWQDYEGGIMTSDVGCSTGFLDMNHCVEVVGYAFTDGSNADNDNDGDNSGSGSGSGSGSRDSGVREGYWIVKNQWSNYWGMNGYAYVAMGGNTCGILNDMTQVFME